MPPKMSDYKQVLYNFVTPTFGGVIVVLNILDIIFIVKDSRKSRKNLSVIYIFNLAISDVIVGVLMIALKSMNPFMKTGLKDDVIAKEIYGIMRYLFIRLSLFVSVFNLIALTVDRLWAITKPFSRRKRTAKFAWKVCAGVWVLSILCSTGIYTLSRFHLKDVSRFNNLIFPISTYTSTTIFVACYIQIYRALKQSRKLLDSFEINQGSQNVDRNEIKVLKLAFKTVSVFVICWSPLATTSLLRAINESIIHEDIGSTFFALAFFNSVLNPFVYFHNMRRLIFKYFKSWRKRMEYPPEAAKKPPLTSSICRRQNFDDKLIVKDRRNIPRKDSEMLLKVHLCPIST